MRYVAYIYTPFTCTEGKFATKKAAIKWVTDAWKNNDTKEVIVHDDAAHTVEYHQTRKQECGTPSSI